MTRFQDMPKEAHLAIINAVDVDDLISLSRVTKSIHSVSRDAVERHLDLCRQFQDLRLDKYHHPLNILYAIRQHPHMAQYVRRIHYHGVTETWRQIYLFQLYDGQMLEYDGGSPLVEAVSWQAKDVASFLPELRDHITENSHKGYWNLWRRFLQKGLHSAHLILLLMHLPRLKRLSMTAPDIPPRVLAAMLEAWRNAVRTPRSPEQITEYWRDFDYGWEKYGHDLHRPSLEIIEVNNTNSALCPYYLESLSYLASSAELHIIRGRNMDAPGLESQEAPSAPHVILDNPSNTALTTLELTDSKISVSSLQQLLASAPNLSTFRMTYSSSSTDSTSWSSLPELVSTLEATHARKIQHLSLINPYDYGSTPQIASFKSFVRLKTLEISLATLLPHSTWREKESFLMSGGRAPPISEVVPPSCTEVTLGIEIAPGALSETGLLRGWPKRQVFPLGLQGEVLPTQQRWGWELAAPSPAQDPIAAGLGFGGTGRGDQDGVGPGAVAMRSTRPGAGSISATNTRHALTWSAAAGAPMPAHAYHPTPRIPSTGPATGPVAAGASRSTYDGTPARALPPLVLPNNNPISTAPRNTHAFGTSISQPFLTDAAGVVVNPLLTRLRKVNYFCCATTVVRCECIGADVLGEYEEGAFLSLEIRRKVMRGWMGGFEEVWEE
ncbi:Hypothetical protein D9617_31g063480 [Elsinoe fawcettii]|nr:Hypothetical protein D9617_31g063480 [Elsinoe fawcettii]